MSILTMSPDSNGPSLGTPSRKRFAVLFSEPTPTYPFVDPDVGREAGGCEQRFEREAKRLAALSRPHICPF